MAPVVEPAISTSEEIESPVPDADSPPGGLEEATEKTGDNSTVSSADGARASYSSLDLRDDQDRQARDSRRGTVAETWVSEQVKLGLEATSKVDYTMLRESLRETIRQARCAPLRSNQEWTFARRVMDAILPHLRRAGYYRNPKVTKVRRSTAESAKSSSKTASSSNSSKKPEKNNNSRKGYSTSGSKTTSTPSSKIPAKQRPPAAQGVGFKQQGYYNRWRREPYSRGDPSPSEGSSSSNRKR